MLAIGFVFVNPFTMIVGSALIASPILIHLINRMRFKRIRWAAMEFLLKAQKSSRRRKILEQLLLLLLRIALVVLFALLLGELVKKKDPSEDSVKTPQPPPKTTRHIVILDDSASMGDRWSDEAGERGKESSAYLRARKTVNEYIVNAVKDDNTHPHEIKIIRTSKAPELLAILKAKGDPKIERINELSKEQIEKFLREEYKPEPFHYDFLPALQAAEEIFLQEDSRAMNLVLHIVSDFRASDWNDARKESLAGIFDRFHKATVQVKLHDVLSPSRDGDKAIAHDNLAIVDFRPESAVVMKDYPVEFTVTVANYSSNSKPALVKIKVNNVEQRDGTVPFEDIPVNSTVTKRVTFSLGRTAPKDLTGLPETAKFDGFSVISAEIQNQNSGLKIDDVRYTAVEVRDKISMLLVDNNREARGTKNADSFYLWRLFSDTYKGFDVEVKTGAEMEKMNLSRFSAIVLCDVPTLSEEGVHKLDSFLNGGGGVGFFMGPSIRDPKFYNEVLWKNGNGMFPAPLKEIANKNLTNEQLTQVQYEQRFSLSKKLVIRNEMRRDPAMEKLYTDTRGARVVDTQYENTFFGVSFPRYYVVDRPKFVPRPDTRVLLYMQNNNSIASYEKDTQALLRKLHDLTDEDVRRTQLRRKFDESKDETQRDEIKKQIDGLKVEMEKYAKYKKVLKEYSDAIGSTVSKFDNPLHKLVIWIDEVLLQDPGDPKKNIPSMVEFWQEPELGDLKKEFLELVDRIKFGDPFYIRKEYKKGRVLAFMGAAGMSGPEGSYWNSLDSISGQQYYPPLMKDSVQRFLCAASGELYLPLKKPFEFDLETAAFEPRVSVWKGVNGDDEKVNLAPMRSDLPIEMSEAAQTIWKFNEGATPGMYLLEFRPKSTDLSKKEQARSDVRALAYNFDTSIESNLQRARTDDLKTIAGVEKIDDAESDAPVLAKELLKKFPTDEADLGLSRSPWLFLGILLALVFEQALAVRLSYHVGNSAGLTLPQGLTSRAAA
jgi:Aerotolerance regulator N-terminal